MRDRFLYMNNIPLAEAILQYVSTRQIAHQMDINDEFSVKQHYKSVEVKATVAEMLEEKYIILMQNRPRCVIMSDAGRLALEIGIQSYKDLIVKTEIKKDRNNIKREIIIGIIGAIVGSIISFLLSLQL